MKEKSFQICEGHFLIMEKIFSMIISRVFHLKSEQGFQETNQMC